MITASLSLSENCEQYSHCPYQCALAALIGSSQSPVKVIEIPTGAGKTWIYALLAKHYCSLGKSVTVIVPNENLRNQTADLIGVADNNLTICTI